MIYNDGFEMDDNLRVRECPNCGNEQFSERADFCRICGTSLFNTCEGTDVFDDYGNFDHHEEHNNPGNARYCELCGKPTAFFKNGFLKPFKEVKGASVQRFLGHTIELVSGNTAKVLDDPDDDGELPF